MRTRRALLSLFLLITILVVALAGCAVPLEKETTHVDGFEKVSLHVADYAGQYLNFDGTMISEGPSTSQNSNNVTTLFYVYDKYNFNTGLAVQMQGSFEKGKTITCNFVIWVDGLKNVQLSSYTIKQ